MNVIGSIVTSQAAHVLGWALLHFLWQGLLIAVLLKLILFVIPTRLAGLRYWTALTALTAMLVVPGISVWRAVTDRPSVATVTDQNYSVIGGATSTADVAYDGPVPVPADATANWQSLASERLGTIAPWLFLAWFCGMILYASVTLGGLLRARHLGKKATSPVGDEWTGKLRRLALGSRIRKPVQLLESSRVSVPTVIGWLRPSILLPGGATNALSPEFMNALLAHELAHIRRRDYLVNLLQTMIEVLLWCHPATWWVAMQVRSERECCCDDEAVAVCGNPLIYARALSSAEHLRSTSKWAMALSGASLLNRVRRITDMKIITLSRVAVCLIGFLAISLILAAGTVSSLLAFVPAMTEHPATMRMSHPSEQTVQPELPVSSDPMSQAQVEAQSTQYMPAQETFVEPTEIPAQRVLVSPQQFVEPTEIPSQRALVSPVQFVEPTEISLKDALEQWAKYHGMREAVLADMRKELVELRTLYDASHPDVIQLSNRIADMETQEETLREALVSMLASLPKIPGYVYDGSGGLLPGVLISLVDPVGRRISVQRLSNADGYFEIESISGLNLAILFELDGFESQVLKSQDLGNGPIEITLELSPVEESIQVITTPGIGGATSDTKNPAKLGGSVLKPRLLNRVTPIYPDQARIDNIEGTVVISALIDEEGQVKDAFVVRGPDMLREAALECVRQWRYSKAMLNGKPWPMRLSLTVEFKLDQ